jgi:hypothetical protein
MRFDQLPVDLQLRFETLSKKRCAAAVYRSTPEFKECIRHELLEELLKELAYGGDREWRELMTGITLLKAVQFYQGKR